MFSSPSHLPRISVPLAALSLRTRIAQAAFRLSPWVNNSRQMATTTEFKQVFLFLSGRVQCTHHTCGRRNLTSQHMIPVYLLWFLTGDRTGCSLYPARSRFTMKCTSPNLQLSGSRLFTLLFQSICQCTPFYVPCRRGLYTSFGRLHSHVPVSGFQTNCEGLTTLSAKYFRPRMASHLSLPAQGLWAGIRCGCRISRELMLTLHRSPPIS